MNWLNQFIEEDNETQLKQAIYNKLSYLLQHDLETFFYWMYRFDIDENKVHHILQHDKNYTESLTDLVYTRMIRIMEARKNYQTKENPIDGDEGW